VIAKGCFAVAYELLIHGRRVGVAFEVEVGQEAAGLLELRSGYLLQVEDLNK
jgi:hypothetical protein